MIDYSKPPERWTRRLLPFHFRGEFWEATAQLEFKPKGLALWNTPPGSMVDLVVLDNRLQVVASLGSVPCRFFAMGDSFEQIGKLLDAGKEPPAWVDWDPVGVGQTLRLRLVDSAHKLLGPPVEVAMWGLCIGG